MTMDEMLSALKTRLRFDGDIEDSMLTYHLNLAINTINDRRQYEPDEDDDNVIETKYDYICIEMAVCSYNKMGAEGQLYHSENSVSRTYESSLYPMSLLKLVMAKPRKVTNEDEE